MDDYRLLQRHKINNVWRDPGFELALPPQLGKWLVEQGVAERIPSDAVPPMMPHDVGRMPRIVDVVPRSPILAKVVPRFKCCGWK